MSKRKPATIGDILGGLPPGTYAERMAKLDAQEAPDVAAAKAKLRADPSYQRGLANMKLWGVRILEAFGKSNGRTPTEAEQEALDELKGELADAANAPLPKGRA